jgi:hypothetical protein
MHSLLEETGSEMRKVWLSLDEKASKVDVIEELKLKANKHSVANAFH